MSAQAGDCLTRALAWTLVPGVLSGFVSTSSSNVEGLPFILGTDGIVSLLQAAHHYPSEHQVSFQPLIDAPILINRVCMLSVDPPELQNLPFGLADPS